MDRYTENDLDLLTARVEALEASILKKPADPLHDGNGMASRIDRLELMVKTQAIRIEELWDTVVLERGRVGP